MTGNELYKDMGKNEGVVACYLDELGFDWYYEHPIFVYDERKRPRVWTPDFYIPSLQLHIEVCDSKDFDYDYRKKIYEMNYVPVVFLHLYEKPELWKSWFQKNLIDIEEERHTKIMKIVRKMMTVQSRS